MTFLPATHLLNEMEQRFSIFDELATKILGPVDLEPREDLAGQVFHLMEKRRICRRNLTLEEGRGSRILRCSEQPSERRIGDSQETAGNQGRCADFRRPADRGGPQVQTC